VPQQIVEFLVQGEGLELSGLPSYPGSGNFQGP